jgi:hypothetical protein
MEERVLVPAEVVGNDTGAVVAVFEGRDGRRMCSYGPIQPDWYVFTERKAPLK